MNTATVAALAAPGGGIVPEWTFPDRLRKARETAGYEQGQLAQVIGVHRHTIARHEAGRSRPGRPVLIAWAMATGVSHVWLETGYNPQGRETGVVGTLQNDSTAILHHRAGVRGKPVTRRDASPVFVESE